VPEAELRTYLTYFLRVAERYEEHLQGRPAIILIFLYP